MKKMDMHSRCHTERSEELSSLFEQLFIREGGKGMCC